MASDKSDERGLAPAPSSVNSPRMTKTNDQDKVDRIVSIDTPEQIQFTFELAGPATRMMAYLVDLGVRSVVLAVISLVVLIATGMVLPDLAAGIVLMVMFALEWGYHTVFEWLWNGSTPGKRAMGIRVVRTNGVSMDLTRSAMRNLLRAADIFPFGYATAVLVMFISKSDRRLGDFAADAMVVREEPVKLSRLPNLPEGALSFPRGFASKLGLKERDLSLIDVFFRRQNYFLPDRSEELASILSRPIAEQLGVDSPNPHLLLASILRDSHDRKSSWISPPPKPGGNP